MCGQNNVEVWLYSIPEAAIQETTLNPVQFCVLSVQEREREGEREMVSKPKNDLPSDNISCGLSTS